MKLPKKENELIEKINYMLNMKKYDGGLKIISRRSTQDMDKD